MNPTDAAWVRERTGARRASTLERLQALWSGYGEILRLTLSGAGTDCVVLKRVEPPTAARHPRGWNTSRSHERKLRSYEVERTFYETYAARSAARVPACLGSQHEDGRWLILLEDLDAAGFRDRRAQLGPAQIEACLRWLADFHATFLGVAPDGLWPVGTYWHLATRPDELAAITDEQLRQAAPILDDRLNRCRFQTFVHGDAKVANFCFAPDRAAVAAVDFQYVGGGCGIKDVAYFLSSCLTETECEAHAPTHLDTYFRHLRSALIGRDVDAEALEIEWRSLYGIAWADFYRFLAGWSPNHWKIHGYSDAMTRAVLNGL